MPGIFSGQNVKGALAGAVLPTPRNTILSGNPLAPGGIPIAKPLQNKISNSAALDPTDNIDPVGKQANKVTSKNTFLGGS